jgi:N4-gp56 family major capsid protein
MDYGDISPRTNVYADRRLLERAKINNILGMFGQVKNLPSRSTQVISFRRYEKIDSTPVVVQEGVTPSGKTLSKTDVPATIRQYGDFIRITDVIQDTHEDAVLQESVDILGMQAGEMWDKIRFGILKAGSNLLRANGTDRTDINSVITADLCRTAGRTLKRQEAEYLREMIGAGAKISTSPIPPAYVAVCHADVQPDIERCEDFVPVEKYSSAMGLIPGEVGKVGQIRFAIDNNCVPFEDAGGLQAGQGYSTLSTTGTRSDVYPILIFGKNAYGIVPLAGKESATVLVANPKATESDPLAQRGTVAWKGWTTAVILNDYWMLRMEVACKG